MPSTPRGRQLTHIHTVQVQRGDDLIDLPATTRRNLELVKTLRGDEAPPCSRLLDTCMTGMGSRLLKPGCWSPSATAPKRAGACGHHGTARRRRRPAALGAIAAANSRA